MLPDADSLTELFCEAVHFELFPDSYSMYAPFIALTACSA